MVDEIRKRYTPPFVRQALPESLWQPLVGIAGFILDGVFIGTTRTRAMRNGMFLSVAIFLVALEVNIRLLGNHGLWLAYFILMIARALTLGWKLSELTKWQER